tara:strand:+ start:2737 stop:3420 length:684 start_codon:yes stop_codon:yes gene_type:complete
MEPFNNPFNNPHQNSFEIRKANLPDLSAPAEVPEHYGLGQAKAYEAPDRNLMQRALRTFVPNYADKQDYNEAADYASRVHSNPMDRTQVGKQMPRMNVYGTSFRDQHTEFDKTVHDEFSQRSFHQEIDNPENFAYRNQQELNDMTSVDQYVRGSEAGTYINEDMGFRGNAIDPYNVASWGVEDAKGLKGLLGMRDYRGSIRSNPGMNPYSDTNQYKEGVNNLRGRVL